jgi:4-amino-4-deoxy-L-arabinose transferase-like glycosyltransferase
VQVVVGLVTCLLVRDLARRMFGERAGKAALWLACLCPFTAKYDAAALAETWSLFCVALAMWGMERWGRERELRWAAVVGCACAWAVLLRPEQGLLAAAVVVAMVFARRTRGAWRFAEGFAGAVVVAVIVAALLGVWAARNWRVLHVVQPLAPKYANDPGEFVSKGFYRWYRTWGVEYVSTANTYWLWDGAAISMKDLPARAVDDAAERVATAKAYAEYNALLTATAPVDAEFDRIARARERRHPVRTFVGMPVARVADMWLRPRTEFMGRALDWWRWSAHSWWSAFCWGYAWLNLAYLLAAAVGLRRWRGWWRDPVGLAMVGFVVLRTAMLLTIDNSEPRYTVEGFPVVFVLAAVVWARGFDPTHAQKRA